MMVSDRTDDVSTAQLERDFAAGVLRAAIDGIRALASTHSQKKWWHATHRQWPSVKWQENGFPRLWCSDHGGPRDYSSEFGSWDHQINLESVDSCRELRELVARNAYLQDRLGARLADEGGDAQKSMVAEFLFSSKVLDVPENIAVRYVTLHDTCDIDATRISAIYAPIHRALFATSLAVDLLVPILAVQFPSDTVSLSNNVSIVRLSEEDHRARAQIRVTGMEPQQPPISAATHALCFFDLGVVENRGGDSLLYLARDKEAYPLARIDHFFTAFRVACGHSTGFCQLLIRPKDWAHRYTADLSPMLGTTVRAYPRALDDTLPPKETYIVADEDAHRIGVVFDALERSEENSIRVASSRLERCYRRETDDDAILDATIGLEALLSDGETSELTHKLALRAAALSVFFPKSMGTKQQVFEEMKKIYSYRSSVVHGSRKSEKKAELALPDMTRVPTTARAIEYLRLVLATLLEHPEYQKATQIDRTLLLSSDKTAAAEH